MLQTNARARSRRSLATALLMGAALGVVADAARAAEADKASTDVGEVVVTGTRIRGEPPVGSALIAVGRDEIVTSGAVTTTQLLQQLPQVFNLGVSENSRGQSGGASNITYGSAANIRGIGPFATLVLVNGHRVVPQGTSGFAVDPSILPTIGLERVDVVADGASAIYGSDAVAGVVNLITRRNLEGGEVSVRYGDGSHYNEYQVGLALGHRWDSGQFTIAYEHGYHSSVSGLDRDYFRGNLTDEGGGDFRVTLCAPGNIVVSGVTYPIPAGGVTTATRASLVAGAANRCDNLKIADLVPRQRHDAVTFTFNQEINDRISVFAEGFAHRRTFKLLGGATSSTVTVPSGNPFFVAPPGLTPATVSVQYSFINDYPQPFQDGFSRAVNLLVGGEVKLPHEWAFEANYSWGRDQDEQFAHNVATAAALTAALNSTNPATAINVFGTGGNSASVINSILTGFSNAKGHTIFQSWEAKADGPLFSLPGGEVRAAVGYEGQRQTVASLQILGTITAKTGNSRYFARGVNSFYGELLVPLVGEGNRLPLVYGLDVNVAGRYDDYSDVGSTTNPKIGVNWAPVEGMRIHGSWGESFRAPGIAQIYGNSNNLFVQNYSDPTCSCVRQGVARSGGNLNLKPETARTYSLGADWDPDFAKGLHLSLTYFDVKYENQVAAFLSDLTVLQRESQFAGTGIILRNPSAAFIAQQLAETGFTGVLPNPVLVFVDGRSQNTGVSYTKGFDFLVSYRFDTDAWGSFNLFANGTRLTKYRNAITPASPFINNLNAIYNPLKFKARYGVRWAMDAWQADLTANYINGYRNNLATPVQSVNSATTVDLRLAYRLGDVMETAKDLVVAVDVRNAFDKDPPFVNIAQSANGGGGFDPTLTSPVGRVVAVSLSSKF